MARHNAAVAKSYAKALYELAHERNQVDAVAKDIAILMGTLAQQPQLLAFLSRPWVAAAAKRGVAVDIATKLGVSPLTRDFLALLAMRNRVDHLTAIAAAFRTLDDQARGRVRVKLRTAIALSEGERQSLSAHLSGLLGGKSLVLEESVDAQLLGGFVAEIGSLVLDGSLDTQLERMRDRLARA
jgi:F-type H+-transporting ATPase subunit delta